MPHSESEIPTRADIELVLDLIIFDELSSLGERNYQRIKGVREFLRGEHYDASVIEQVVSDLPSYPQWEREPDATST